MILAMLVAAASAGVVKDQTGATEMPTEPVVTSTDGTDITTTTTTTTEGTDITTTEAASESTTTEAGSESTTTGSAEQPAFTCPTADGYWEDPKNCIKYYECKNNVTIHHLCGVGERKVFQS